MNRQQTEILALAIENEAADAARLSNVKSALAMKAQALIGELNLTPTSTVAFALTFAEQAEIATAEWVSKKFKANLTAGAMADLLEMQGEILIKDFVQQLGQARKHALVRKAEQRRGIVRNV